MHRVSRRLLLLSAALALAIAGCGGDAGGTGDGEEVAATADPNATWEPEWVDGVLQPLPDGFPDSRLTVLVVDEANSTDGIYGRHVQQVAENMAPVPITVLDRPDFGTYGTWEALEWMSEQEGGDEGYIMGVSTVPGNSLDLISTPVAEDLGVDMHDLNFVLGTEVSAYTVVTRLDAPWGDDLAAMFEWAKENPGELRYISHGPGSGSDLAFRHYAQAAGIEADTSVGGSHTATLTTIGAGEADVGVTNPGAIQPYLQDGTVLAIACSGQTNPCFGEWDGELPNVMSVLDGVEGDNWGANRSLFVTPETPDSHRLWLEELVRTMAESDEFSDLRHGVLGIEMKIQTHEELDEVQTTMTEVARPILEEAGLLVE